MTMKITPHPDALAQSCRHCHGYGCVECEAKLTDGKTCADCAFLAKCKGLIGRRGTETTCDWIPSRFWEPVNEPCVKETR